MANILMVVSAADSLTMKDGSKHPTGYWAEELVVAHRALLEAGHTVDVATPGGIKPTVDEVSLEADSVGSEERAEDFRTYLDMIDVELFAPLVLADVDTSAFDAVVLPGGHGPMTDLSGTRTSAGSSWRLTGPERSSRRSATVPRGCSAPQPTTARSPSPAAA